MSRKSGERYDELGPDSVISTISYEPLRLSQLASDIANVKFEEAELVENQSADLMREALDPSVHPYDITPILGSTDTSPTLASSDISGPRTDITLEESSDHDPKQCHLERSLKVMNLSEESILVDITILDSVQIQSVLPTERSVIEESVSDKICKAFHDLIKCERLLLSTQTSLIRDQ